MGNILTKEDYNQKIEEIKQKSEQIKYGAMTFTEEEQQANQKYLAYKDELKKKLDPDFASGYTLRYKRTSICQDPFYKLICKMPKGAANHLHYGTEMDFGVMFPIFQEFQVKIDPKEQNLVVNKEAEDPNAISINHFDRRNYQLEDAFNQKIRTWPIFEKNIWKIMNAVSYSPLLKKEIISVCYDYLEEGNIDVLEVRYLFGLMVDKDKNPLPFEKDIEMLVDIIAEIRKKYPQFHYNIVAASLKVLKPEVIQEYFVNVVKLIKTNENARKLIKGFDLVCEEDLTYPLNELTDLLIKIENLKKQEGIDLPWLFHSGESLGYWNTNLYDALIFNTKRIGHGLNLSKHAYLMEIVKQKNICIEANPLSNQVLQYYEDLRTHPLQTFFNNGIKVTISPDSNGLYGSKCSNDDFFVVAVCMEFDLKGLKKLCLNSLECSLLEGEEKEKAIAFWEQKWISFIKEINSTY